jgi:hypothetical protein
MYTTYQLDRTIPHEVAAEGFMEARRRDVQAGGPYDARSAAILVWSSPWDTPENERLSEIVGTVYIHWHSPDDSRAMLTKFEVEAGHTRQELELHLRRLFHVAAVV